MKFFTLFDKTDTEGTQQQGIIIVIQEIQGEIIQRQHKRSILDYLQT
jgi:hypothetical protein